MSHHNKGFQDRREVCGEPRERTHPATDVEGEAGVGSSSEPAPAQSPDEALRFEWFHECGDCGKRINTRWKYCRRCVAKSRRKKVYPSKMRQTYPCGCTSSSNRDVTAKDWHAPDPECVACGGSGRLKDKHRYLKRGRKPKAAPDVSIEAGSYEDGIRVIDAVMAQSEDDYTGGNDTELDNVTLERFDLAGGGWGIETGTAAVPHRPGEGFSRGRIPEGIVHPERIRALFEQAIDEHLERAMSDEPPPFRTAGGNTRKAKSALDAHIVYELVESKGVNVRALAQEHAASETTIKRWVRQEREVRQKYSKDQGGGMGATQEAVTSLELQELRKINIHLDEIAGHLATQHTGEHPAKWAEEILEEEGEEPHG